MEARTGWRWLAAAPTSETVCGASERLTRALHTASRPSYGTSAPSPKASPPRPTEGKVVFYVRRSPTRCSVSGLASSTVRRTRLASRRPAGPTELFPPHSGAADERSSQRTPSRRTTRALGSLWAEIPRPIEVRHKKHWFFRLIGEKEAGKGTRDYGSLAEHASQQRTLRRGGVSQSGSQVAGSYLRLCASVKSPGGQGHDTLNSTLPAPFLL
ncbi:hypothetical protein BV20DRAFT_505014 [Pilatotrama ljubarskyi]|nr:hypothetical protein BV20DRAFT_505014 [Pilatotrama ljubarskyi]